MQIFVRWQNTLTIDIDTKSTTIDDIISAVVDKTGIDGDLIYLVSKGKVLSPTKLVKDYPFIVSMTTLNMRVRNTSHSRSQRRSDLLLSLKKHGIVFPHTRFEYSQENHNHFVEEAEVIKEACKSDWTALQFAATSLLSSPEFVLKIAHTARKQLANTPWPTEKELKEFALAENYQTKYTILQSPLIYSKVNSKSLVYDSFIKKMIKQNPLAYTIVATNGTEALALRDDVIRTVLESTNSVKREFKPPHCKSCYSGIMKRTTKTFRGDSKAECGMCEQEFLGPSHCWTCSGPKQLNNCEYLVCVQCNNSKTSDFTKNGSHQVKLFHSYQIVKKVVSKSIELHQLSKNRKDKTEFAMPTDKECLPYTRSPTLLKLPQLRILLPLLEKTFVEWGDEIKNKTTKDFRTTCLINNIALVGSNQYQNIHQGITGRDLEKGDHVIVTTGKWKDTKGEIDEVLPSTYRLKLDNGRKTAGGKLPMVLHAHVERVAAVEDVLTSSRFNSLDTIFLKFQKKVAKQKAYEQLYEHAFEFITNEFLTNHQSMTALHLDLHTSVRSKYGAAVEWWDAASEKCWDNSEWCLGLLHALGSTEYANILTVLQKVTDRVVRRSKFRQEIKRLKIVNETILNTCLQIVQFTQNATTKQKIMQRSIGLASDKYLKNANAMYTWHEAYCPALNYADSELRLNKEFMMKMISSEHDGFDFPAATVALRSDIEFIFSGLEKLGGKILNHVPNAMRKNMILWRKVVGNLTIIAKSPLPSSWKFINAPKNIKSDFLCVQAAIQKDPKLIHFASRSLLSQHRELVIDAVTQSPSAIYPKLSNKYKNDIDIALIVARKAPDALTILSPSMKEERNVVAVAMKVMVPINSKWTFLYACCIDRRNKQYSMWTINDGSGTLDVHFTMENRSILTQLIRNPKKRRGRSVLYGLGGLGRGVLHLIFQYAAWKIHRPTRLLLNVDIDIAKEWVDDYDSLFFDGDDAMDEDEEDDEDDEDDEELEELDSDDEDLFNAALIPNMDLN